MFEKLNWLVLCADDLEESKNFYKNLLGLEQVSDKPSWKAFKLGESLLALRPWTPGTEDERHVKHGIYIGFHVADVDDAVVILEQKGAHILVDPRDEEFGRYAEIADPNGYIIMLMTERKQKARFR
ncbi:hypothetical protein A2V82_05910 [candidate division KSB1 bacterium RBG_16_48_16]|nr:MAG: hypothetical protein A2V82_05910 [candidate division KSB1 bacterium RBG_16_48_16]